MKKLYLNIRRLLLLPLLLLRKTYLIKTQKIKNILFIRHDRVGDMVLSTPVFKALKRKYPDAKLTVLASDRNYEIIKNNPYVDEILIYKGFVWFIKETRSRGFDLAIDAFFTYELKQAFMTCLSGARYRLGFEESGREVFFNIRGTASFTEKRMVEHLLDLVKALDGEYNDLQPEIFLTDEEINRASDTLSKRGIGAGELKIAIHPGGYYPSQRWPAKKFGEVVRWIHERCEVKVLLFGSRGEENLLDEIKEVAGNGVHVFANLGLREFMALLSKSDIMVCNNSGPLHIASALKIPTVSITGPTVTPLWLPYGDNHIVINKGLSCSPCNKAVCKDHRCMESITAEEVIAAVRTQIARIKSDR